MYVYIGKITEGNLRANSAKDLQQFALRNREQRDFNSLYYSDRILTSTHLLGLNKI